MNDGPGSNSDQDEPTVPPRRLSDSDGTIPPRKPSDSDATISPQKPSESDATIPPQQPVDSDATIPPRVGPGADATIAPNSTTIVSGVELPEFEGYELLEVLGRGGMGVVYKARDQKLDRTVALKMIIGGKFASDEEVRRFQIEAESSARLDHPNIVPIYEIGQSKGNHFFSMKLIEGKSLSECLDDYQSEPRKSAQLISQIARAVHHAHERGILHRDLKPANILIDENGTPAITDLGLAKQMDDDSGMTQTGLVMGSPGFMSPEQAAGKSDVTTGVDVYALGALLFWLITGRPPFEGDSRLDVIMQTIDKTPESVRVFVPNADRDLNLICQKALQKSASDRYATAAEFADDVDAWLQGDALSVKPPTTIDHARIWIRKNFRTVSIALSSGILCGTLVGMCTLLLSLYFMVSEAESFAQLGDSTTPWVTKYFSWVRKIPVGVLFALPPFMIWLNVVFGIVTIRLIRPTSREIGLVAATAAALLAGVMAYTVNLGWSPMEKYAIDPGRDDIELISDGFWLEDPQERALAQKSLFLRYPGLKEIRQNERGERIFKKIVHDQSIGIPRGMWVGILTTLCLAVFPLFFSTALAGLVWDQGHKGWAFFGQSIEVGIYAGLLFLLLAKWSTPNIGTPPMFLFHFLTMAGIGLALYWAIAQKHAYWRILGFVLANACIFLNFAETYRIDNATSLLASAESDDEIRVSAKYFEKKLHFEPEYEWGRFQLAITYAYLDDEAGYRRQCDYMLSHFRNIYRPEVAERLVKACLLKPNVLSDSEQETCRGIAEMVSGYDSVENPEWLYFARALAEMREGDLNATLIWNEKCRVQIEFTKKPHRLALEASTHIVDAIAYRHAGENESANSSAEKAKEAADDSHWNRESAINRMTYDVLTREFSDTDDAKQ